MAEMKFFISVRTSSPRITNSFRSQSWMRRMTLQKWSHNKVVSTTDRTHLFWMSSRISSGYIQASSNRRMTLSSTCRGDITAKCPTKNVLCCSGSSSASGYKSVVDTRNRTRFITCGRQQQIVDESFHRSLCHDARLCAWFPGIATRPCGQGSFEWGKRL